MHVLNVSAIITTLVKVGLGTEIANMTIIGNKKEIKSY
jgi:hypothetical protein